MPAAQFPPDKPSPDDHLTDRGRVDRIRAGDAAEYEALFHAQYEALCAFAMRFAESSADAEEIVQHVFVDLWTRRSSLRIHTSLRAYLYAATHNRALDQRKHERVVARWTERSRAELDVEPASELDAQQVMETSEAANAVHAAIAQLPDRARLVVTLRWLRGLRPPEIAEALGISVKGVEIQITRALRALRNHLREDQR